MENNRGPTYKDVKTAADIVLSKIPQKPLVGLICGSGLGELYQILNDPIHIPYEDIPGFPQCGVHGHQSILTYGTCADIPVVCFRGRFHLYEGHSIENVIFPVRLFKLLGGEMLVLSNAAGSLNEGYAVGDIMLFKDHINMVGLGNPIKSGDEQWGPKFFSVTYNKHLSAKAKEILVKCGYTGKIHEGIYACVAGPSYETAAEVKMLKICGADAVGMSTVPEIIAAVHCGLQVVAFSMITDKCVDSYDTDKVLTHEEVLQASQQCGKLLLPFFEEFVLNVAKEIKIMEEKEEEEEENEKNQEKEGKKEIEGTDETEGKVIPENTERNPEERKKKCCTLG